jgi:hypothetical protein
VRALEQQVPGTALALRVLQNFLVTQVTLRSTFDTCH